MKDLEENLKFNPELKTNRRSNRIAEKILNNLGNNKVRVRLKKLISGLINLNPEIVNENKLAETIHNLNLFILIEHIHLFDINIQRIKPKVEDT